MRRKHLGNVSASGLKRNRSKGTGTRNPKVQTDSVAVQAELTTCTTTKDVEVDPDPPTGDYLVDNYCQTLPLSDFDDTTTSFNCFTTAQASGAVSATAEGCYGAMSSIETQTDLFTDDLSLMSSFYNSNDRHTQTCDQILQQLLFVNDIETQTIETQT